MASNRFVILAIDSTDDGVWVVLRCTKCGQPSGFHFQSDLFRGRYPLLCECGAEVFLEIDRPVLGPAVAQEFQSAFPWAPAIERRMRPNPN